MMTRQSMARVSSASLEADFAPAVQTPFDWEAAPGRAAEKSTKSGFYGNFASEERDSDEVLSLPLPPGRRPKDGFYLPYSREFESPYSQSEVELESGGNSSKPRKLFNLKFPGSSKKPSSTSRMNLPFQSSSKPPKARRESRVDDDQGFTIFNPISGHRFGSSITNRMLMQFQKKQSLWRRCLPSKPESEDRIQGSSPHVDPNRGRRLDEGFDDGYVIAADSPLSGPLESLPSSPRHGHHPSSNSSPIATKQVQVNSSRFMASMLISLCPDDAGDSEGAQLDAEDGNSDDYNDEIGSQHLTTPRTKSSSPEPFEVEVEVDPASQTSTSQEKCTCTCRHGANISARVDSSTAQVNQREKTSRRSLHEELTTAKSPSEHSRSGKLAQPRSRGTEDSPYKFNENIAADQKNSAESVFFKASSNKELLRSRETCKSTFSWKLCTEKSPPNQEPVADSAASDAAQEPRDSEFANDDDDGEEYERRGRDSSSSRMFSTGSNRSSSPEFNSLHKTVWSLSPSITKDVDIPVSKSKNGVSHSMSGYLSPPRISFEDLGYTGNSDTPKPFARWRSTAKPSVLRRSSLEAGGSERKQAPATKVALNSVSPLQKQALQRSTKPSTVRIRDLKQAPKSSSLRPIPSKALHALAMDDTEESSDDSDYSTDASGYETPPAVSSPMLPNSASPQVLMSNLHSQQSRRESPRISPFMEDQETTSPGPSFKQIMLARSYSVRSSSSRRFTPQEHEAISADHAYFRGPIHLPSVCRLAKTSSSSVMSKVALFESKAGVSKSGPLSYT